MTVMAANHVVRTKVYCGNCGKYVVKRANTSWHDYNKRKYCGSKCLGESKKGLSRMNPDDKDQTAVSDYIEMKTANGRLMADFNIGVLQAVNKVKDDKPLDKEAKGVICSYKGVQVTGDIVNKANEWLMNNWKGKPGQRSGESVKKDMDREELLAGIKAMEKI
jgi:hypothetical protein